MKISVDASHLDELVLKMGASRSNWMLGGQSPTPRILIPPDLIGGIEVDIGAVGNIGGLLEYDGKQVLLYIKDTKKDFETLKYYPEKSQRFHIAECRTLDEMRSGGRFNRYHVANRLDGKFNCGWFDYSTGEEGEIDAELKVCKNCLEALSWGGYSPNKSREERNSIWYRFDIANFLREFETVFYSTPARGEDSPVSARYVQDWPRISEAFRQKSRWICQGCNVDLSGAHRLLHTHHIDGDIGNNSPANLKALCVVCHGDQPFHGRMKVIKAELALINKLRK